jgi:NAD(P)-dependent dehydrogenase (short-subunit alcohol dehydrogenase family)
MTQDLKGKTIVIAGASSGIGAAAARRLARRGATAVPVGRSADETAAIAAELGTSPLVADYTRLGEVRALADQLLARHRTIDVLAHNAGGFFPDRRTTEDGHERTLQVNYLAPFLLQSLLHERLSVSRAHASSRAASAIGPAGSGSTTCRTRSARTRQAPPTPTRNSPVCSSRGRSPGVRRSPESPLSPSTPEWSTPTSARGRPV